MHKKRNFLHYNSATHQSQIINQYFLTVQSVSIIYYLAHTLHFFLASTFPVLSIGIHICYSIYIMCRLSWIIKISWSSRKVTYMNINNSYFSLLVTSMQKPKYWKIIPKRTGKERPEGRKHDRKNIWHQVKQGKKMVIYRGEGFPWSTHIGTCSLVQYPARGAPTHDLIWTTGHLCWSAKESSPSSKQLQRTDTAATVPENKT